MPNTNNTDRQSVLTKFCEIAEKLAASDDAEIRAIYKGRLEKLVPELIAAGLTQSNFAADNVGIIVQDSDVRDVIQQITVNLTTGGSPDTGGLALRESYLSALVTRLNKVRLIGGEEWAERVRLASVYTALMTDRHAEKDMAEILQAHSNKEQASKPVPAIDVLNAERKLVLLGGPGSGKSTFANMVAACMGGALMGLPDLNLSTLTPGEASSWSHGPLLPVIVELREFAAQLTAGPISSEALWNFIAGTVVPASYAPDLHVALLKEGGLFLLDGLDEVPDANARRAQIKQAVQDCIAQFPKCRFLVTSRTYAYQSAWQLDGFARAEILPFTGKQKAAFVDAWYAHIAKIKPLDSDDAKGRAFSLKNRLQRDTRLSEIAERPLLLTLIARLHLSASGDLPSEREPIYDQSVKMLLSDWEREKVRKRPNGDYEIIQPSLSECLKLGSADALRPALQRLAYDTHRTQTESRGPANIAQDKLLAALTKIARDNKGSSVNPLELEDYLRDRAGILVARGEGVYQFPHRTFQEYLAAQHLIEELTFPDELSQLVKRDLNRWREAAQLAAARTARVAPPLFWDLIDELARGEPPTQPTTEALHGALMAGQALLDTGLAVKRDLPARHLDRRARVQRWMRHIVETGALSPADRLIAGDALAALGDDRPGVGLRPDGLPDIVWCEVPDDGPFLYGADKKKRKLPAFRIAKYLITYTQFQAFVDATDGWDNPTWWEGLAAMQRDKRNVEASWPIANRPRESVNWYAAVAFTRWLSHKLGLSISLPTEEQWEKAARGKEGREYPWGDGYKVGFANIDETSESAKVGPNYLSQTSSVGMYPQSVSPYGLHDCAGNVFDWCLNEDSKPANIQVSGTESRVLRGGSWIYYHWFARCAYRFYYDPDSVYHYFGLRCVLSPSSLQASSPSG